MLKSIANYLADNRDRQRIAIALAKGGAMRQARQIDLTNPATWEFSGFSQNGEDGIIEVLRRQLRSSNRSFLEIGSANGVENNSAWLVVAERYEGLMIEGNPRLAARAQRNVVGYSIGTQCRAIFVTTDSVPEIIGAIPYPDPDVFSLDIDGNDYHIARGMMNGGLRPRIVVVEYNSVYGQERSLSVTYRSDFSMKGAHPSELYYGVSITGWRRFFEGHGYRFVTVDRNGVNAFFVDPQYFDTSFLDGIHGLDFAENRYQLRKFGIPSEQQFLLIADQNFISI
ncbi:hypothetical protein [Rhodanobacter sp. C05]|uniref:hypothetical protein n=1 Tax=Rhodanobacter sp. C05 TaxID=1945855 RepID=UPI001C2BCC9F|nr:hypothetical protein [Rhodanobacter sp. C05]